MSEPDSRTLAHASDPETSHAAAADTRSSAHNVKRAILFLLVDGPDYAERLTLRYGLLQPLSGWPQVKPDSIAKRLSELHMEGLVVDSGKRHRTQYGKQAVMWELADS